MPGPSELREEEFGQTPHYGQPWNERLVEWVRRMAWTVISIIGIIVAVQAAWPKEIVQIPVIGAPFQKVLQLTVDRPALERRSQAIPRDVPIAGFAGYIRYVYADTDCASGQTPQAFMLELHCLGGPSPAQTLSGPFNQVMEAMKPIEAYARPWDGSDLVMIFAAGDCLEVVGISLKQTTSPEEGAWLPVRRMPCHPAAVAEPAQHAPAVEPMPQTPTTEPTGTNPPDPSGDERSDLGKKGGHLKATNGHVRRAARAHWPQ